MKNKKRCVLILLAVCFSIIGAVLLPSGSKMQLGEEHPAAKSLSEHIEETVLSINDDINAKIFDLPKVYTLPLDLSAAPTPNPENFTDDTYQDETITVKCWKERIKISDKTVTANFAEITIAHPTQLRTAFAGGSYGTSKRESASKIAYANNAVLAINADFYNYRPDGLIIRQGSLYRKKAMGIDTLFIDSDGNFIVMEDSEAISSGFIYENKIYQTIVFGPVLVQDGKAIKKKNNFKSMQYANNPRTAIGQIGKLHYLTCTIDGRSNVSIGCSTNELADIMADKGCIVAYNLDGGHSSTMIFNNEIYNAVSNGGERKISDIIYFATALPDDE